MQKRDGQGETEANTKGGTEEAKGGEEMQKINREDVVQAALTVERWCKSHAKEKGKCECPFNAEWFCWIGDGSAPCGWDLEYHLSKRGLKRD